MSEKPQMIRSNRRAVGLLLALVVIASSLAWLLCLVSVHLESQLPWEVQAALLGDRARLMAESLIDEMTARFQKQANTPGTVVFDRLRDEVLVPDRGAVDLSTLVEFPTTRGLLDDPRSPGLKVDETGLEVSLQKHLDDLVPYERQGYVSYRCRASCNIFGHRLVERRAEILREFRVCLVNVPHPYCRYGLFVDDLRNVIDPLAANRSRDELLLQLRQLRKLLEALRRVAPGALESAYDELLNGLPADDEAARRSPGLPACATGSLYGLDLTGETSTVELPDLDLAARLEPLWRANRAEVEGLADPASQVRKALLGDAGVHRQALDRATAAWHRIETGLKALGDFHRRFTIQPELTPDGAANPHYARLRRSAVKFGPAYWLARAQFVVEEGADGDLSAAWNRFLERHPRPTGVIHVRGRSGRLALRGRLEGRCVLVLDGVRAEVEDLDPGQVGHVTLVCTGGSVSLAGEIRCGLVVGRSARLTIEEGTRLAGCLVVEDVPRLSTMRASLTGDPAHHWDFRCVQRGSGALSAFRERLFVSFPPAPCYVKVTQ